MKQKTHDNAAPNQGTPDKTSGDGVLKDLAEKAKTMAAALDESKTGDPRRRGEIEIAGNRYDQKRFLKIDGVMWAEVQWAHHRQMWCIQDACGYCMTHVEHIHCEVPNDGIQKPIRDRDLNPTAAIDKAKSMIRDGSMPSPEDARKEFKRRTGNDYQH